MHLGNWLADQIIIENNSIKQIIAIYPGRFQPFGKHHAQAFKWLRKQFGKNFTFIATSNKTDAKSPFSFNEKKAIIKQYGIDNVIQSTEPYKAIEIVSKYNPETTAVVFMVGQKDMDENPRFKIGKKKSGEDSYFQDYNEHKHNLQSYRKHGYLITAPHTSINIPGFGEMSGTALRNVLKSADDKTYNDLLGITDPKIISMMRQKLNEGLIIEGGAGGHMAHPFDIPSVKNGKDLLRVFVQSVDYLKEGPAAVKIDGINASIRLVIINGKRQFVLDRGSNKSLDVKGVTKDDLLDRFGAGHGMIKIGGTVLDIFNDAIPSIQSELKKLGLWDNPNILFNIEYVSGSSNVLSYVKNFLAIHGLLEIQQITPTRRGTVEKQYNSKILQTLLNKLGTVAKIYGFEVIGSIPTVLKSEPNFSSVLNQSYTVIVNGKQITKTLNNWLIKTKNVKDDTIKLSSGKTITPLSKEVLVAIKDGVDVANYVAEKKYIMPAINGYIMYIATMELGQAILNSLSSPLGPVSEHEGIVIRDHSIYEKPFKITGRFILKGLESQFR